MKLTELLKNLDDDSLKLLAKFDKGIEKKVGAEKKAILQKMAVTRWSSGRCSTSDADVGFIGGRGRDSKPI